MNKYVANEVYRTGNIEEIEVTMSSDKEGQMLKWNDEITYTVTIKNTGEARGFVTRYTHVNLFDLIPRELQPISATYNNYILEQIEVPDVDYPDIMRMVQKFSEETVNLDLSNLIIQDGYDEETAPNINEYINISIT